MVTNNSSNNYASAKFIVSSTAGKGNYTTIASAITAANTLGSPETIAILPGTYTENLTLQPGINLTGWGTDTNSVTIVGKLTFTQAGTVNLYGLNLQTNSDYFLSVTGSAASFVNVSNCFLNCSNNPGINLSSSSGTINVFDSQGDLSASQYYFDQSNGNLIINNCYLLNTGASTTNNTSSAGTVKILYSTFNSPSTTSGTSIFSIRYSIVSVGNNTAFTSGSSNNNFITDSLISTGSATSIVANSSSVLIEKNLISSTNATSTISGSGTVNTYANVYNAGFSTVTTSSQGLTGIQGVVGSSPKASSIGEQIRSSVISSSAISLSSSATTFDITSILLTPGTWSVSGVISYVNTATTGTNFAGGISSAATTNGIPGDQRLASPYAPTAASGIGFSIPSYVVTVTTNTTYYLNAQATYTVTAPSVYGRISAIRIG